MLTSSKLLNGMAAAAVLAGAAVAAHHGQAPPTEPDVGRAVYVGDDLLKDYQPRSELVTKQTHVERPRFPAIDIHAHWGAEQDPRDLLQAMNDLGVRASVNLSGGQGPKLDEMLQRFTAVAPDRLLTFANIDFSRIDEPDFGRSMAAFLNDAHARGASGLKIFKSLGLTVKDATGRIVAVDDPRLDPIWTTCGERRIPVLVHSADPAAFFRPTDRFNERWMQLRRFPNWSFYGPRFPAREEVFAQRNRIIERHPETVFIAAHLADSGEDLATLAHWLDRHPNLYVDLSGRVSELGRQPYSARRFLIRYQDRVLFGTDRYPGRPDQPRHRLYYRFLETEDEYFEYYDHPFPPSGDWRIYGVFLPDDVLEKIYRTNAERALRGERPPR
jgi:uncharacterized protein